MLWNLLFGSNLLFIGIAIKTFATGSWFFLCQLQGVGLNTPLHSTTNYSQSSVSIASVQVSSDVRGWETILPDLHISQRAAAAAASSEAAAAGQIRFKPTMFSRYIHTPALTLVALLVMTRSLCAHLLLLGLCVAAAAVPALAQQLSPEDFARIRCSLDGKSVCEYQWSRRHFHIALNIVT